MGFGLHIQRTQKGKLGYDSKNKDHVCLSRYICKARKKKPEPAEVGIKEENEMYNNILVIEPTVRVGSEHAGTDSGQGLGFQELEALLEGVVD